MIRLCNRKFNKVINKTKRDFYCKISSRMHFREFGINVKAMLNNNLELITKNENEGEGNF